MASERYFIGPGLKDKLREVIYRVDSMPVGQRGDKIPYVESGMPPRASQPFRICTFTGTWSKNTEKIVTFKFQTDTPNTVQASNLFANVEGAGTRNCAIAREGTAWYLIAAECD